MTLDKIVYIATGVSVATILGYFARPFIQHLLAKSRSEQERLLKQFNEAAERFREAFTEEIQRLRSKEESAYIILTPGIIDKHDVAAIRFEPFLKGEERRRFKETCQEYYDRYRNRHISPLERVAAKDLTEIDRALEHINKLLSFAKPK